MMHLKLVVEMVMINVIHFMEQKINIAFDNMIKMLKKDGIIIIIEPIIKPYGWQDDRLNKKLILSQI